MKTFPKNRMGKWAVSLTFVYVILIVVFFVFFAVGLVNFDTGHWWDITVGTAAPIALVALVLSIFAVRKERTVLTLCSLVLGILLVIFLLTHSLYIHD